MPHATRDMPSPTTNGTGSSSKFISHALSYPVVSDGVETFKANPIGKKSIDLAEGAYQRVVKPVEPHLETPYSYVKPYVGKADELGKSSLEYIDQKFPIVKEDTSTLVENGKSYVFWPVNVAYAGKDYVLDTFNDQYDKVLSSNDRKKGLVTLFLALISTVLKIASDFFQAASNWIGPKYEEGKKKGADYVNDAKATAEKYKDAGEKKLAEYQKAGEQKASEYQKAGEQKTEQAKQEAAKAKDEASKKVQK